MIRCFDLKKRCNLFCFFFVLPKVRERMECASQKARREKLVRKMVEWRSEIARKVLQGKASIRCAKH